MSPLQSSVPGGEPSRTAHTVALLRAVHQLLDEPLILPDPVALPILGAAAAARLSEDPFALNDPISRGLRAAVVARSRFVEDELTRCIGDGVRQYVLLGAGLDTFACRCSDLHAGLRVFEVDRPEGQRWKQLRLAEAGIGVPSSLRFVPLDLERDDLLGALATAGFRADQPACVGWMGVTMYLSAQTVGHTLAALARLADGSHVLFDHRMPAAMLHPIDRAVDELLGAQAAGAGEPWLSSFDPGGLQQQLLDLGFTAAASVAPEDLNARYFARRRDGLCVGRGLRIMRACTGPVRPA